MRKISVILSAAAVFSAAAVSSVAQAADYRWQFFGALPVTHDFSKKIMAGLERVAERSEGRLEIQYSYIAETPYKPAETLTLIRDGLVQMTEWLPANGVGTYPVLAAPELPFISPTIGNPAEMQAAVDKAWESPLVAEAFQQVMDEHGAMVLGRYYYQPMNLWSAKPLASRDDFKGQRIRVVTPEQGEFLAQLGTSPMNIPNTEVYTSLQTNVIDGVVTGSANVKGSKWDEVLKSGYIVNMTLISARMVISKEALEELPEDLQAIVIEEMTKVGQEIHAFTPASDQVALEELAAAGVTITHASAEDYAAYRALAAEHVWPGWKSRVGEQADLIMQQIEEANAQ